MQPPIPQRPLLHGARTWLRPLEERDLPAYMAAVNDTETGGPAGYRMPYSMASTAEWLQRLADETAHGRGYFFAVCELGSDAFIGTTWLKEVSMIDGNAELAICMDGEHLGAGWGTDAQRALLAFAFGTLRLERVWLTVDVENARAIRSYEKIGFVREGVMRRARMIGGRLADSLLMAILREEWEAAAG